MEWYTTISTRSNLEYAAQGSSRSDHLPPMVICVCRDLVSISKLSLRYVFVCSPWYFTHFVQYLDVCFYFIKLTVSNFGSGLSDSSWVDSISMNQLNKL